MTNFKYIELFAGIGGFRQALDQLGGQCVFASEIDKHATQSYEALYGGVAHLHGDITKVAAEDVPDHDILVGGFPCQAFSQAGKRLGFEDTRGTLFFEALRIAKHHRPKALLLENVKGLVNHAKGDTLSTMLHALNDVGYTVDFDVLNSKYFGVPQSRNRVFIVAIRDDLIEAESWIDVKGTQMLPKAKKRMQDEGVRSFNFKYPEQLSSTARLRDILEPAVDGKYYLSDDKKEKISKWKAQQKPLENIRLLDDISPCLTARGAGEYHSGMILINDGIGIRVITEKEAFRLQGFSDEAHEIVKQAGVSDSQRYKQAGNAVTVNVIRAIGERLLPYLDVTGAVQDEEKGGA